MSDLHIVRSPESPDNNISAGEWLECIEADPEIQRKESADDHIGLIEATVVGAEEWESLRWRNGWISASYPQDKMVSKMSELADRLGAVLMSDDGIIFTKDMLKPKNFRQKTGGSAPPIELSPEPPPLPAFPEKTIRAPWFLKIPCSNLDVDRETANQLFSEAVRASLKSTSLSLPILDLEEACSIAERLIKIGLKAEVSGHNEN